MKSRLISVLRITLSVITIGGAILAIRENLINNPITIKRISMNISFTNVVIWVSAIILIFIWGQWAFDKLKRKRKLTKEKQLKREFYLLQEISKAQTAARYNFERIKFLENQLVIITQTKLPSNTLILNDTELENAMINFPINSMELIRQSDIQKVKDDFTKG